MLGVKGKFQLDHAELKRPIMLLMMMINSQYLISRPKPPLCISEYDAKMRPVLDTKKATKGINLKKSSPVQT